MRVNLVCTHRNQTGLAADVDILQGIWAAVDETIQFRRVLIAQPECLEAEMNVFLELLNPSLFTYAAKNIFIPNPEWCYKAWIPNFASIDEIWCKTHEAVEIFKQHHPNVKYIGWTSIAKRPSEKKNFHKALYLAGKNIYRHPQLIVDAYVKAIEQKIKVPELHVVYDGTRMNVNLPDAAKERVILHSETLKQGAYDDLVDECGLSICLSGAEGFGHAVNEAASTGAVLLLNEIEPFKEFGYKAVWAKEEKPESVPHPECMGVIVRSTVDACVKALETYADLEFKTRKLIGKTNHARFVERHDRWAKETQEFLKPYTTNEEFSIDKSAIPEDDLPGVTIVTPTRNRPEFIEICAGCVDSQCYPKYKLEWIILDDGKDTCDDFVSHIPYARHVLLTDGKTIAQKRNLGAKLAKHEIIVHMDDDDIYPPNSILFRVSMMLRAKKQVAFCTTLPSYDIANYISFVNVPPMRLPQSMRVSEATMCYTKKFWEEKGFPDDIRIAEGEVFIKGREAQAIELSPQEIIVSLVHPKTTSSRRVPKGMEPNGCHFGFTEDLFTMLSKIGERLKTSAAGTTSQTV
jgi:hypothetical protein